MLISGKNGNLSFEEQRIGSSVTLVFSYFCLVVCGVSSIVPRFLLPFNCIIRALEFHIVQNLPSKSVIRVKCTGKDKIFKSQRELWHNLSFLTPTLVTQGVVYFALILGWLKSNFGY